MLKQAIYALENRAKVVKSHIEIYNNLTNVQSWRELKHLHTNNVQELESIEEAIEVLRLKEFMNSITSDHDK